MCGGSVHEEASRNCEGVRVRREEVVYVELVGDVELARGCQAEEERTASAISRESDVLGEGAEFGKRGNR